MIFYFSGTGNSEWVAKQLSDKLEDQVMNIADKNQVGKFNLEEEAVVGFVFPIYAWAVPPIMMDFIKQLHLSKNSFVFAVCTCESEQGNALKKLSKQLHLHSTYTVLMPNNYTIMIKADKKEVVQRKLATARQQLTVIADNIKNRKEVLEFKHASLGGIKTNIIAPLFNAYAKNTWKKFWVQDSCNGCGLCEKNCPKDCIKLVEKKPVWSEGCVQCLSCYNRCPKTAIQFGKRSIMTERYYMREQK